MPILVMRPTCDPKTAIICTMAYVKGAGEA